MDFYPGERPHVLIHPLAKTSSDPLFETEAELTSQEEYQMSPYKSEKAIHTVIQQKIFEARSKIMDKRKSGSKNLLAHTYRATHSGTNSPRQTIAKSSSDNMIAGEHLQRFFSP